MNILEVDLREYVPSIVDAFIEVWGEDFRSIVLEKSRSIHYINYVNLEGVFNYCRFLKVCRQKEFNIKFLEEIGIEVPVFEKSNLHLPFGEDVANLVKGYLGSFCPFDGNEKYREGIFAFDDSISSEHSSTLEMKQINFLNFLRGEGENTISDYAEFKLTDEYSNLLSQIVGYLEVYKKVQSEMQECYKEIQRYQNFVESEENQKKQILDYKRSELYLTIESELPNDARNQINRQYETLYEKSLLFDEIGEKSYVEYFSMEDEANLQDPNFNDKKTIYFARLKYLEQIGVFTESVSWFKSMEQYIELVNQVDIHKYIPSFSALEIITKERKQKYEEGLKEFICSSQSFIQSTLRFNQNRQTRDFFYKKFRNREVCVFSIRNDVDYFPALFFTVRPLDGGILDFVYLHEFVHALEFYLRDGFCYSGFDTFDEQVREENPYRSDKRKYERMNETIADIFALRVRDLLHKKGIYFFEPKEIIRESVEDRNTHHVLKDMVVPFLDQFRYEIVLSRLTGNIEILYDKVGKENFEALNDCINKVDYLLKQGLIIDSLPRNNSVLLEEYQGELTRLEGIYQKMNSCALSNSGSVDIKKF